MVDNIEIAKECYVKYMEAHEEDAKNQHFHKTSGGLWNPGNKWQPNNRYSISEFLGTHNWSKSTVANLLKLHKNLDKSIQKKLLSNPDNTNRGNGISKSAGLVLSTLKDKTFEETLFQLSLEKQLTVNEIKAITTILNSKCTKEEKKEVLQILKDTGEDGICVSLINEIFKIINRDEFKNNYSQSKKRVPAFSELIHNFDLDLCKVIRKIEELKKFKDQLYTSEGALLFIHLRKLHSVIGELCIDDTHDFEDVELNQYPQKQLSGN